MTSFYSIYKNKYKKYFFADKNFFEHFVWKNTKIKKFKKENKIKKILPIFRKPKFSFDFIF